MFERFKATLEGPWGLPIAGILLSTGSILTWRTIISPFLKHRRREQAEEFATIIFNERQKRMVENGKQEM